MKKLLTLFLIFVFLFSGSIAGSAASGVTESPKIKVFVDGTKKAFGTPVLSKGVVLLPSSNLMGILGSHSYDASSQSLTLIRNSIKLQLKIGSSSGILNGKSVKLPASPIVYQGKPYVPAEYVAKSLGKKTAWDSKLQSLFIVEASKYNKIKALLEKANKASLAADSIKINIEYGMGQPVSPLMWSSVDIDKKNMREYAKIYLADSNSKKSLFAEAYLLDRTTYQLSVMDTNPQWTKAPKMSAEKFKSIVSKDSNIALPVNDLLCSSLVVSETSAKYTLKGNSYVSDYMELIHTRSTYYDSVSLEIMIDKKSGRLEKVNAVLQEKNQENKTNTSQYKIQFSNYNHDFKIALPQAALNAILVE